MIKKELKNIVFEYDEEKTEETTQHPCPFHPRREGTEKVLLTDDGKTSYPEWVCTDCLETLESSALGLA